MRAKTAGLWKALVTALNLAYSLYLATLIPQVFENLRYSFGLFVWAVGMWLVMALVCLAPGLYLLSSVFADIALEGDVLVVRRLFGSAQNISLNGVDRVQRKGEYLHLEVQREEKRIWVLPYRRADVSRLLSACQDRLAEITAKAGKGNC